MGQDILHVPVPFLTGGEGRELRGMTFSVFQRCAKWRSCVNGSSVFENSTIRKGIQKYIKNVIVSTLWRVLFSCEMVFCFHGNAIFPKILSYRRT